jgi:hypothetical protein
VVMDESSCVKTVNCFADIWLLRFHLEGASAAGPGTDFAMALSGRKLFILLI